MPMAREAGIAPRTLQELLSLHRWDEQLMVDTLQRHVWRRRGSVESVATILESCCPKKGTRTPGVELQRCGTSGRTRNCVQLLHLGLSEGDFNCILDNAIYLPRTWTDSPERRERARIPETLKHRTKPQIALDLLDRAAANGVRFGWLHLGIDYASDVQFLKELDARGLRYVAPRPSLREGGPTFGGSGPWITNRESGAVPEVLARAALAGEESQRWLEIRRREIGLDHFEVRTYRSLLRHLTLSSASLLFLEERGRRIGARKAAVKSRAL
jgi:SRSO17 transposase